MRLGREMSLDPQISAGNGPAPAPISSHFLDDPLLQNPPVSSLAFVLDPPSASPLSLKA